MFHLLIELCGAALINAALPSLAIVTLACGLMYLRGWSASTRYFAWCLALCLIVLLPFCPPLGSPAGNAAVRSHARIHTVRAAAARTLTVMTAPERPGFRFGIWADLVGMLCCCAVLVQLVRFGLGWLGALRLKRRASACTDRRLMAFLSAAGGQLRLRREVSLLISDSAASPVLVGYFRPAIVLPAELAARLEAQETEQVLAHELAHAARYDDWAIAVQRLIEALFAFHPLVRMVGWRMSLDREIACDDRVIASLEAGRYAACLTRVAELVRFDSSAAVTVPLLARRSNLGMRIEAMLDRRRSHAPALSARRALAFSLLTVGIAVAGLRVPALIASPLADRPMDDMGPMD